MIRALAEDPGVLPGRERSARLNIEETAAMSLVIREATSADIPALAHLHVKTWRATYECILSEQELNGPTYEIRERQWRAAFKVTDGSVFCFVVQDDTGQLVGFAAGRPHGPGEFSGELSKIYLLVEYQRQGLGRRLVGHVARRFLTQGVSTMLVFADGRNPSCRFYEALGAERLREETGEPSWGNYGWRDLRRLAAVCPIE
jgi:ribosomal protein S18 acetylase RimI-like enzyme